MCNNRYINAGKPQGLSPIIRAWRKRGLSPIIRYYSGSADPLINRKIANFDFLGLVDAFDAAGAPTNWALTNALLNEHLSGSDTAALGGDLAYRYGLAGTLANIGFDPAVAILSDASFGTSAQTLQSQAALEQGIKRLS